MAVEFTTLTHNDEHVAPVAYSLGEDGVKVTESEAQTIALLEIAWALRRIEEKLDDGLEKIRQEIDLGLQNVAAR